MSAQPNKPARQRELAQIHIAKKDLRLDDDTYRAMLYSVARVHSAAELDAEGRRQVLAHMKARGFKARRRGRTRPAGDKAPLIRKVRALLADAGRTDGYADGMAKRMFGTQRFEWLTPPQLGKLVAALSIDQRRRNRG